MAPNQNVLVEAPEKHVRKKNAGCDFFEFFLPSQEIFGLDKL